MTDRVRLPVAVEPKVESTNRPELSPLEKGVELVMNEEVAGLNSQIKDLEKTLEDKALEIQLLKGQLSEDSDFDRLHSVFQEMQGSVKDGLELFSNQASDVVVAALIKILGKSLLRPEVALAAISEVINSENASEIEKIIVSPADYILIEKYSSQLGFSGQFKFVSDLKVKTGGCILELGSGLVDGRIDVQLKTLHELLRNVRGG
ncbi:MAG: FliH/SctL family protein [Cycloclasticus sp.]